MRKLWKKMKNKQGFTLMEMLIVVAIIAVLVAIAIPVYQGQVHKAKVAADWANVRAYYADIQMDYLTTGILKCGKEDDIPYMGWNQETPYWPAPDAKFNMTTLHFLNKQTVELQAGYYLCTRSQDENGKPVGYQIAYFCDKGHENCHLILG